MKAFNSKHLANQTWAEFKSLFATTFGRVDTFHGVRFARLFSLRPTSFAESDIAIFINTVYSEIATWARTGAPAELAGPLSASATQDKTIAYLVKTVLVAGVPALSQDRVFRKVLGSSLHDLPQDLARAMGKVGEEMPGVVSVNYAGGNGGNGRGRGGGRNGRGTGRWGNNRNDSITNTQTNHTNQPQSKWNRGNTQVQTNPRGYNRRGNSHQAQPHNQPHNLWLPKTGQCWKCCDFGHRANQCRQTKACPFHNGFVTGHSFDECATYPQRAIDTVEAIKKGLHVQRADAFLIQEGQPPSLLDNLGSFQDSFDT